MKTKRVSSKNAMKQAFNDMKSIGLHPSSLFKMERLIKASPECTLRLGLFGI